MMRDKAITGDMLNGPAERWPAIAYVFTAVSFLGILASALLLVTGSDGLANVVATSTVIIAFLQNGIARSHYRSVAVAKVAATPENERASKIGQTAGLGFLFVCYLIVKWTAADTIILTRDQLTAAFFITVAIILTVPPTYLLWRTRP